LLRMATVSDACKADEMICPLMWEGPDS